MSCKGDKLNTNGKDIALIAGQPAAVTGWAGCRAYVAPTMSAVAPFRQQDQGSGLPEHAHARLTQPCLCFPVQQRKAGMFPCPTPLLGRFQPLLSEGLTSPGHCFDQVFARKDQLLMSLYNYPWLSPSGCELSVKHSTCAGMYVSLYIHICNRSMYTSQCTNHSTFEWRVLYFL